MVSSPSALLSTSSSSSSSSSPDCPSPLLPPRRRLRENFLASNLRWCWFCLDRCSSQRLCALPLRLSARSFSHLRDWYRHLPRNSRLRLGGGAEVAELDDAEAIRAMLLLLTWDAEVTGSNALARNAGPETETASGDLADLLVLLVDGAAAETELLAQARVCCSSSLSGLMPGEAGGACWCIGGSNRASETASGCAPATTQRNTCAGLLVSNAILALAYLLGGNTGTITVTDASAGSRRRTEASSSKNASERWL